MPAGPAAGMSCTRLERSARVAAELRQAFPATAELKGALAVLAAPLEQAPDDWIDHASQDVRLACAARHLLEALERMPVLCEGHSPAAVSAWREHSLEVACLAAALAQAMGRPDYCPAALACGLLHDVGKPALQCLFPKAVARLRLLEATASRGSLPERSGLGLNHPAAGRALLREWGAPQAWAEAVGLHHQPPAIIAAAAPDAPLALLVAAANRLVHATGETPQRLEDTEDLAELGGRLALGAGQLAEARRGAGELREAILGADPALVERPVLVRVSDPAAFSPADADEDPWLAALSRFTAILPRGGEPDEIAAACAEACGRAWNHPVAAYLLADGSGGTIACWDGRQARAAFVPMRRRPPSRGAAVPADTAVDELRDGARARYAALLDCENPQHGPLTAGGRTIGGIFAPANMSTLPIPAPARASSCFSAAVAWALECGRARGQALRAADAVAAEAHAAHEARGQARYDSSVASIAEMAAGAAHELNNPLAVIAGRAQMLRREVDDEELDRQLSLIDEQARRASQIVAELVQFAKPDPPQAARIQLGTWVRGLCQYWQTRSSLSNGRILVQLADPGVCFRADPAQLEEAAHAVIGNAVEAMSPLNACLNINSPARPSDEHVVVSFGDNGRGMTPDILRHACDPFYSSRPAGRGRGMGLSRAARLLQVNGGRLTIESAPNVGTRVSFILPVDR